MTTTRRNLWISWAIIVGAAFAISGFLGARGIVWLIVAVVAAAGYTVIHMMTRQPPGEPRPGEERGPA